jgi:hypothetical protein
MSNKSLMSDFKMPTIPPARRKQLMQMVDGPYDYRLPLIADFFGKDARTLRRWCEAGHVRGAFKTPGGHWRIRADGILDAFQRVRVPSNFRLLCGFKKDGTPVTVPFEKRPGAPKYKYVTIKRLKILPVGWRKKRENKKMGLRPLGLKDPPSEDFRELWTKVLDEENLRRKTDGAQPRHPFPGPHPVAKHMYAIAQAYIEAGSWRGVARILGIKKSTFFYRYTLSLRQLAKRTYARLINFGDLDTGYGFEDGLVGITYHASATPEEIRKWRVCG